MAKIDFSTKRLQINKANARIVVTIALAAVLTTFSLVASRALLSQRSYQARVIAEKKIAADQLKKNREAVESLKNSYTQFVSTTANIIGGDPKGTGDRDGDSAKIILDALPSKYDFPALTSSLEKLLVERNFKFEGIVGFDDELVQTKQTSSPSPVPIEIPFQLSVTSDFNSLSTLIQAMEKSIRPFHIVSISFSGNDQATKMDLSARTYYQPAKSLDITTKDVQ
jgi:Tfp pilus assembly protein PilO